VLQEIVIDELRSDSLLELSFDGSVVLICIDKLVGEGSKSFDELGGCDLFVCLWNEGKSYFEK
jgi:hypothetical protein